MSKHELHPISRAEIIDFMTNCLNIEKDDYDIIDDDPECSSWVLFYSLPSVEDDILDADGKRTEMLNKFTLKLVTDALEKWAEKGNEWFLGTSVEVSVNTSFINNFPHGNLSYESPNGLLFSLKD